MDLFNKQITLNVNSSLFIIIAGVVLLLIILIVVLVLRSRKPNTYQQSKHGFLGKSLYGLLGIAVVSAGLIFAIAGINNDKVFEIEAKKTLQADIITNVLLEDNGKIYVDFKVVPTVEGKVWGNIGDKFDIYWTYSGSEGQSYSYIESGKSETNRSGLQKYFDEGTYKINVSVVFENNTYTFTKDITF